MGVQVETAPYFFLPPRTFATTKVGGGGEGMDVIFFAILVSGDEQSGGIGVESDTR